MNSPVEWGTASMKLPDLRQSKWLPATEQHFHCCMRAWAASWDLRRCGWLACHVPTGVAAPATSHKGPPAFPSGPWRPALSTARYVWGHVTFQCQHSSHMLFTDLYFGSDVLYVPTHSSLYFHFICSTLTDHCVYFLDETHQQTNTQVVWGWRILFTYNGFFSINEAPWMKCRINLLKPVRCFSLSE